MTHAYLTVQQFARLHGVHPVTARMWCATGLVPAQKIGRDWLIPAGTERPADGRSTRYHSAR